MYKLFFKKILSKIPIQFIYKLVSYNLIYNKYKSKLVCHTTYDRTSYFNYFIKNYISKIDPLIILEFGVYKGESIEFFSKNISDQNAKFIGFDTFTGLPEKWINLEQGHFTTNGIEPKLSDKRVSFRKGLFEETLPPFLEDHHPSYYKKNKFFIHFDADLFSSTLFVLKSISEYIPEYYFSFDEFPGDEIRALDTFSKLKKIDIKFICKQQEGDSQPSARVFGHLKHLNMSKNGN